MRRARGLIYREQVICLLPSARGWPADMLPVGMTIRLLEGEADFPAWIDLLNVDAGFGRWDEARLRSDILDHLLRPNSVAMICKEGSLIGVVAAVRTVFRRRSMATGTFLIVAPKWRGNYRLALALLYATQDMVAAAGEDMILVATYPDRLSAIALYLARGAQPCYVCLWSVVQWFRLRRRLGPVVGKLGGRR